MNRIGLYGGTFDPVHRGHVAVARAAVNEFALGRLYVVPVYQAPHRPGATASFDDRLAMARLAFAGWPDVAVSDLESKRGGISYTIDSIETLRQLHPDSELCLVVGADTAGEIETWREPKRLAESVHLLVAPRAGCAVNLPPQWRYSLMCMEPVMVSATDVRRAIRDGRPIGVSVPDTVAEYIAGHRVYNPA